MGVAEGGERQSQAGGNGHQWHSCVFCIVLCCVVLCCVVLCCVVLCCVVLCCVVLCCVVLCCVVLCCVVQKALIPMAGMSTNGCLPTGTGKRKGSVYSARAVCKCVDVGGKRGGETWRSSTRRLLSAQKLPLHSLSPPTGAGQLLQHPRHHAVRAQADLQQPWRGRTRL